MDPGTGVRTRQKLDREAVVDAALRIADAEGLEVVTIRRLAHELSVTPMALYWHFKDKDRLLAAVADRLWEQTATGLDRALDGRAANATEPDDGWAQLRLTLEALLDVMRRHPSVTSLMPMRVVECDAGLSVTERTLAFLDERGFDRARAANIARYVLCSAVMLVDSRPGAEITHQDERTEVQRRKWIALASLPPDRYPHVTASAAYLTDSESPDAYFGDGAALVVAGVRDQAPRRP